MMRRLQRIRKRPAGNTSTVMFLGFPSSSLYLQLPLDLVPNCLPCEFLLANRNVSIIDAHFGTRELCCDILVLINCIYAFSTVFIFILALVGVFYPYNRGALFTALVVIYALTSGIAGYTATSFYCQLEGTNWVLTCISVQFGSESIKFSLVLTH